ncbi:ComEC/Rec2 family competence protein [Roseateles sp. L2-2]|uniref:ComEC/Rec2 family competence protein n=1 Tax=Roseateles sp. L2-2 TaxID=3422597 RepID=UPI003D35E54F
MKNPFDAFVSSTGRVPLFQDSGKDSTSLKDLLWGDGVRFLDDEVVNGRRKVRARGTDGWINPADVEGGEPLLELYFIDVGQGDSVIMRTPDFRHLLIDGGFPRTSQPSMKSAADFVDWKFAVDYGSTNIELDAMIASHNDHDHYGGLDDLLDVEQINELRCESISVENFYHAGLSWWKDSKGKRTLGKLVSAHGGPKFFTQLLHDRTSAEAATDGGNSPQLQGAWGAFIRKVVAARDRTGQPTPITRLSADVAALPGFSGGSRDDVDIRVLGPIADVVDGEPALKQLGADSISTNGHSVTLSISYGNARLLLTGDLNKAAHDQLLLYYADDPGVFACDVAKCCHHGSEDVSFRFLETMEAGATVISSGDAEGHDHPRPRIVAASGVTGHREVANDRLITPLVYSTEIARSLELGRVTQVDLANGEILDSADLLGATVRYKVHKPGSLRPALGRRRLGGSFVVAGMVYGLVNVRTDGRTILCATLNEGSNAWTIKTFKARF